MKILVFSSTEFPIGQGNMGNMGNLIQTRTEQKYQGVGPWGNGRHSTGGTHGSQAGPNKKKSSQTNGSSEISMDVNGRVGDIYVYTCDMAARNSTITYYQ